MRTALLVTNDEMIRTRLHRAFEDRSLFAVRSDDEAYRTLRHTPVDLVVKHVVPPARDTAMFLARTRQLCQPVVVICICPPDAGRPDDDEGIEAADFVLIEPFAPRELEAILRQAEEKLSLLQELAALRASRRMLEGSAEGGGQHGGDVAPDTLAQVVKEFAKALAAGFHLPRVLDLFLDAVAELARPSRSAILLADEERRRYRVQSYRGLVPQIAESVVMAGDGGLALWLAGEARILHAEEAQAKSADALGRDIARDLAVLQAVVAIPLLAHGELVGILTLGRRVTGGSYGRRETETLFGLATHLATAIRDIRIHQRLEYQRQFTERILTHLSKGVVSIGPEHQVVLMNRRAEEILGMTAAEALNHDLRVLPSPLGDLLFETLSRTRTTTREEVQLALRNIPLEVSTYPVLADGGAALGAVVVFEDLTAQRQLALERRQAEQLGLLTRVVARIADEIKNPLVSIRTFMELLEERYDDASFRHQFASVVGRDVRRLVQMFEKLSALVNDGDYKLEPIDARTAVEECLTELAGQPLPSAGAEARLLSFFDDTSQRQVATSFSHEGRLFQVRGDRTMLKKAIGYLVRYLVRRTEAQEAKIAIAVVRNDKEDRVRITITSRTAEVRPDELHRIFDPIHVVQENLIDVGPCVSQRIIEGQGGTLEVRQGRHEVAFTANLPGIAS